MERIENISFRRRERLSTTQIAAAAIIVFSTLKLMAEPLPAIKKDLKEASASYCYGANMVNHMKNPDYRTLEIPKEIQVAWTEIRNIKAEDPKSLWEGIKRLGDRNKEIDYCAKFAEENLKANKKYVKLQETNKSNLKRIRELQAEIATVARDQDTAMKSLNAYKYDRLEAKLDSLNKELNKLNDNIEEEYGYRLTAMYIALEAISRYPRDQRVYAENEAKKLIKDIDMKRYLVVSPEYDVLTAPDALRDEVRTFLEGRAYFQAGEIKYYAKGSEQKTPYVILCEGKLKADDKLAGLIAADREMREVISAALLKVYPPEQRNKVIAFLTGELDNLKLTKDMKDAMNEYYNASRPQKIQELINHGVIKAYPSLIEQWEAIKTAIRETKKERVRILNDLKNIVQHADALYSNALGYKNLSMIYESLSKPLNAEEKRRLNELRPQVEALKHKPSRTGEEQEELEKLAEEMNFLEDRDKKYHIYAKLAKDAKAEYENRMARIPGISPVVREISSEVTLSGNAEYGTTGYTLGSLGVNYNLRYGKYQYSFFGNFNLGAQANIATWGLSMRSGDKSLMYYSSANTGNLTLYFGPMPYSALQEKGIFPLTGQRYEDLVKPSGYIDITGAKMALGSFGADRVIASLRWPIELGGTIDTALVPRFRYEIIDSRFKKQNPVAFTIGLLNRSSLGGVTEYGGGIIKDEAGNIGQRIYLNIYDTQIEPFGKVTAYITNDNVGGKTTTNIQLRLYSFKK